MNQNRLCGKDYLYFPKKGFWFLQGKVEICGGNTSKLPVLKNDEAQALLDYLTGSEAAAVFEAVGFTPLA